MTAPEKRALITGGAHRVGRAIATDLAAHGYDVAIHANTSATAAQALADDLGTNHSVRTAVVTGDLADPDAVATIVPAAIAALGPLSLLINNASVFEGDALSDMTPERWRRQMAVNAEAPAFLAQAFAASTDTGLIVNIIDQRVWKPTPRHFSYSASKATLWWLTRTMAQALAPKVRVMAIGPGPVLKAAAQSEADFAEAVAAVPLQRAPALAEFGAAIRFMAATPSMTGQMLALDGGQHLAWETPDALINE
ncbi:MAG: SDR family oxidoreductase [Pseudomonadota bacterium]